MTPHKSALDKLRELDRLASKGPWKLDYVDSWQEEQAAILLNQDGIRLADNIENHVNAKLIVAARNLLPAFLDFVETIQKYDHSWDRDTWESFRELEKAIEREVGG